MPITLQYNPSFVAGGQLARDAGKGRFLQDQARFDYQRLDADRKFDLAEDQFGESQRQFDETLEQRGSQYDRSLQNQVNQQALRDKQYQQGLAQRDFQFRRQLDERGYQFDEEIEQRREMFDAKIEDRARDRAFSSQEAERDDFRRTRERQESQQYGLMLQEREAVNKAAASGQFTDAQIEQMQAQSNAKWQNHPAARGMNGDLYGGTPENALNEFGHADAEQRISTIGNIDGEQYIDGTVPGNVEKYMERQPDGSWTFQREEEGVPGGKFRLWQDTNAKHQEKLEQEKAQDDRDLEIEKANARARAEIDKRDEERAWDAQQELVKKREAAEAERVAAKKAQADKQEELQRKMIADAMAKEYKHESGDNQGMPRPPTKDDIIKAVEEQKALYKELFETDSEADTTPESSAPSQETPRSELPVYTRSQAEAASPGDEFMYKGYHVKKMQDGSLKRQVVR